MKNIIIYIKVGNFTYNIILKTTKELVDSMGRPRKWKDPDKIQQAFLLNRMVNQTIKSYAVETGQSYETVIHGPFSRFENELLDLCREIDRMRQNAIIARMSTEQSSIVPVLESS